MKPQSDPKLAPPGAGLPPVELFFVRLIMGFRLQIERILRQLNSQSH